MIFATRSILAAGFAALFAVAQLSPALAAAPATQPSAWDDIDQRMVFFTVQLASVETSVDAVNKALKMAGYKITLRTDDAAHADKGNEYMDRNAGGPVRWQDFYGRTAEKFFYNPAPHPGELRLTATVLRTSDPRATLPKPADQRPPQFDYIYRANDNARARAEAEIAKLAGKVDQLLARRRQLESEQSALWCKVAFRPVAGRELLGKPLYRFDLKTADVAPAAAERLEALRSAMTFLRINNRLIELSEKAVDENQAGFVVAFEKTVADSRADFDTRVMMQPSLVQDASNKKTTLGKLEAVAKRMHDVARNVADAYKLALDGDKAGDSQRKDTFRAQLQESLVVFAEAVAAGDECVNQLALEWKIVPDLQRATTQPNLPPLAAQVLPDRPIEIAVPDKNANARPSISGTWQEAPAVFVTITQNGGEWSGRCSYLRSGFGEVRWEMNGTINQDGEIVGTLQHTSSPKGWKKLQVRRAKLSEDGNTISGTAKWEDGGDNFTWIRKSEKPNAAQVEALPGKSNTANPAADDTNPKVVNLLAKVDLARDVVAGSWTVSDGVLKSDIRQDTRLQFPFHPPAEYDLKVSFSREEGNDSLTLILAGGETQFSWTIAGWQNTISGFSRVDGIGSDSNKSTVRRKSFFENGKRYEALLKVRDKGVQAYIDGKLINELKMDYSHLTLASIIKIPDGRALGVVTDRSVYKIYKVEIGLPAFPEPKMGSDPVTTSEVAGESEFTPVGDWKKEDTGTIFTFNESGTFVAPKSGNSLAHGTWRLVGKQVFARFPDRDGTFNIIDANTMDGRVDRQGERWHFTRIVNRQAEESKRLLEAHPTSRPTKSPEPSNPGQGPGGMFNFKN